MNLKRFGYIFVCLVLICLLIVNISPIGAHASSALATLKVASITLVDTNPLILAATALICLGVMANSDAPEVFMDCASAVAESVADFGAAVYRVVTDAGDVLSYVSTSFLETVRGAAIDEGIIYNQAVTYSAGDTLIMMNGDSLVVNQTCHKVKFVGQSSGIWTLYEYVFSNPDSNLTYYLNGSEDQDQGLHYKASDTSSYRVFRYSEVISASEASGYPSIGTANKDYTENTSWRIVRCFENGLLGMTVAEGLTCGLIPSVPVDGSSALKWSEEYGSRQLRLIESSGGDSGEDPDGDSSNKVLDVLLPLGLVAEAAALIALTQKEEWSGEAPVEFPDMSTHTEFEILDTPEVDGYPGVEVSPVPDTIVDPGTTPGSGSDSSTETEAEYDYLTKKVLALRENFVFADSIIGTIEFLSDGLEGLGTLPPVVYVDLGAAEGSYIYGGRFAFMDLSWYEKYKPYGDAILSTFLWWVFMWKLFVKLPGIINGLPGDWVQSFSSDSDKSSRIKSNRAGRGK